MTISDEDLAKINAGGPRPGELFRHHKGGVYIVIARAIRESDMTSLVIYQHVSDDPRRWASGELWSRPLADFSGFVETPEGQKPRFERYLGE